MDASNLLKPALARGELHCVGATTLDEYRKHVEKDAALARRFQPVFVMDVADAVVAALGNPAAAGRTYEIGGPDVLSFRAILAMINTETRQRRTLLEVPAGIAALMGKLGDLLPFMPMTSDQLAMLAKDNIVGVGMPGLADLGVLPTPMAAFVPAMLERYRPSGRFNQNAPAA
jgi:NADH dehydrogenase